MIDDTYLTGKVGVSSVHPFVEHFKFVKQFEDENTVEKQTIPAPAQFLEQDRKSTRLNSSHRLESRMPSSA